MERDQVREIVAMIRSYHPATQFARSRDSFQLLVPGGPTSEQDTLMRMHKQEIFEYLTTPPLAQGECWRGHSIRWVCTSGGIWVCLCYYWTAEQINYQMTREQRLRLKDRELNLKYRNYWTKESGLSSTPR